MELIMKEQIESRISIIMVPTEECKSVYRNMEAYIWKKTFISIIASSELFSARIYNQYVESRFD